MANDASGAETSPQTVLERRQAAEIETVYGTAPIGLALFDSTEFRYVRANGRQAEFFACAPEDLIGKTVTEMAPIPGVQELFEQVAAGIPVENYPLEGELVGRPGEYRYWIVNYHPVYGDDGSVQAISAASLEITQQRKAERALVESERQALIGRLVSSITHEINNPLEAVGNLLYLAMQDAGQSSETKQFLTDAQSELARASQIATRSLQFGRRGKQHTDIRPSALTDSVLQLFHRKLLERKVAVERDYSGDRLILCDENEIKQVLSNLVDNAIDSMPQGGRLKLRVRDAVRSATGAEGVRFTLSDTGQGMSSETKSHIYDAFFTTKAMRGNGLGLWISADIVNRHQGSLSVRSSEVTGNSGTTFSLFLPSTPLSEQ